MSAVLTPPQPPSFAVNGTWPQLRKWTVDEFNNLGALSFFTGRRAVLIDGVIWEQGPMDPPHADGVGLVHEALRTAFGPGWYVRVQLPLNVDVFNNPFPDLAVVRGGVRDHLGRHPTTAVLVVEVSDSTLDFDLTVKAERYATAGVEDYWVLDLDGRQLLVFRDPAPLPAGLGATAYRTRTALGPADTIAPLAAPGATVAVADLLP